MTESTGYVELGSEQGAFTIRAWDGGGLTASTDDDNLMVQFFEDTGDLLVLTGDQFGPFGVTTRRHESVPVVADGWEDVVEVSVETTGPVHVTEVVENDPSILLVDEPGAYRLRISAKGRGRQDGGTEDEDLPTAPLEHYLIEAWPAPLTAPSVVRLTSVSESGEDDELPHPPETEAGLAGARAIGRDVDRAPGCRTLSGETGTMEVHRRIKGTRRRLFGSFAVLQSFSRVGPPFWSHIGRGVGDVAVGDTNWAVSEQAADPLPGRHGAIKTTCLEVTRPSRLARSWNWVLAPTDRVSVDYWVPFLAADALVTVTFAEDKDETGQRWTDVQIRMDRVPVEWVEDLAAWWKLQLAVADAQKFGVR